jgi:hypothetical protein
LFPENNRKKKPWSGKRATPGSVERASERASPKLFSENKLREQKSEKSCSERGCAPLSDRASERGSDEVASQRASELARGRAHFQTVTGGAAPPPYPPCFRAGGRTGGRIHKGRDHWRWKPETLQGTFSSRWGTDGRADGSINEGIIERRKPKTLQGTFGRTDGRTDP